jgi:glycosyltransferase involved in cell wall biosynthesis
VISVIVPIYNEIDSILPLHAAVADVLNKIDREWELLLVNDGSSDGSPRARQARRDRSQREGDPPAPQLRPDRRHDGRHRLRPRRHHHPDGRDLQNDPTDIPRLLAKLDQGFDVVSGWRKGRKDAKLTRNLPSWFANKMISWISGVHLHDYGCSLKAYHKSVIKESSSTARCTASSRSTPRGRARA